MLAMKIILPIIYLLFTLKSFSQNIPFEKSLFKERKDEYKIAKQALEDGIELYEKQQYELAINKFDAANKFNPNNAELNFLIGKSYLASRILDKKKALQYLLKAYDLNPTIGQKIHLFLGQAYHFNAEWTKAIDEYQKEKALLTKTEYSKEAPVLDKKIKECNYGISYQKNPVRVFVDNLGPQINSKYAEYGACITTDESMIFFTSRRNDSYGSAKDETDDHFLEDIYMSNRINGQWQKAKNLGSPINTDNHDATCGLSLDGKTIFIYRGTNLGDLYEADFLNGTWTKPEMLNKNVSTNHRETSASLSFDGKTLFFVSDRGDLSLGGLDIFMSKKDSKGRWGVPTNLGPIINTPYDEEGIFAHPDGKTLYFSSRGHTTMGGFDVFKSVFENGQWTEPQNLGYPINHPDDDVFFVVNANGKRAYYASTQDGGYGQEDLYVITMLGPEKPMILNTEDIWLSNSALPTTDIVIEPKIPVSTNQLTLFKGRIIDSLTKLPLVADILMIDNNLNQEIGRFVSDNQTGKFLVTLPSGNNYNVTAKAEGYLFQSVNFDIPKGGDYQVIEKDIILNKVAVGMVIVLNNIFFDNDKFTLRKESEAELDNLHKLLTDNPTLKIEIDGHTDNRGGEDYNQKLSENRARAVVTYLVGKGISQSRLTYKGLGLTKPIANNASDEGRQLNRRTEFRIVGK